jgi:hypothetical protein
MDTDFIKSIDNEWTRDTTIVKANNIGCTRIYNYIHYIKSSHFVGWDSESKLLCTFDLNFITWLYSSQLSNITHWKYHVSTDKIHMIIYYVFWNCCKNNNLKICQWLYKIIPNLNITIFDNIIFNECCKHGHFELCQWLYSIKPININETMFILALYGDNIHLVKWLYELTPFFLKDYMYIFEDLCKRGHLQMCQYIHRQFAFRVERPQLIFTQCCYMDKINVCKWLYESFQQINIISNNHHIFKLCCANNRRNICLWLCEMIPQYSLKYHNSVMIAIISIPNIINKDMIIDNKCCVCLEDSDAMLPCNHVTCLKCSNTLEQKICPLCRVKFNFCYIKN